MYMYICVYRKEGRERLPIQSRHVPRVCPCPHCHATLPACCSLLHLHMHSRPPPAVQALFAPCLKLLCMSSHAERHAFAKCCCFLHPLCMAKAHTLHLPCHSVCPSHALQAFDPVNLSRKSRRVCGADAQRRRREGGGAVGAWVCGNSYSARAKRAQQEARIQTRGAAPCVRLLRAFVAGGGA